MGRIGLRVTVNRPNFQTEPLPRPPLDTLYRDIDCFFYIWKDLDQTARQDVEPRTERRLRSAAGAAGAPPDDRNAADGGQNQQRHGVIDLALRRAREVTG